MIVEEEVDAKMEVWGIGDQEWTEILGERDRDFGSGAERFWEGSENIRL